MEKRLVVFLLASVLIMIGFVFLRVQLIPPPDMQGQRLAETPGGEVPGAKVPGSKTPADGKPTSLEPGDSKLETEKSGEATAEHDAKTEGGAEKEPAGKELPASESTSDAAASAAPGATVQRTVPEQWLTLGSFAPDSPYRILVTFSNRGAAVERVELVERRDNGLLRYRDLSKKHGYLGLHCRASDSGCEVTVVGAGTPAALAKPSQGTMANGLRAGDIIEEAIGEGDSRSIRRPSDLDAFLEGTKPWQSVTLRVRRGAGDAAVKAQFQATLDHHPLELIQPEAAPGQPGNQSFLLGLCGVGDKKIAFGEDELPEYLSLRNSHWQVGEAKKDEVVFRQRVPLGTEADAGELEFVKRFAIVPVSAGSGEDATSRAYQLRMTIEVINHTATPRTVAHLLDGPTGLPLEGWWYLNKIHPSWGGAGARDVIWRVRGKGHSLRSAVQIYKQATDEDSTGPFTSVLAGQSTVEDRTLDYIGVDTQYFSAVMQAGKYGSPASLLCQDAYAMPVGPLDAVPRAAMKTLNTTYRLIDVATELPPDAKMEREYHLFLGPKSERLLADFALSDIMEYGWFGWIAKPLSRLLHIFHAIVGNYGLAIIMLTVLVRGLMFPIGRKAARNAQMMQELAPEIKKIKEKYKNDLEKQTQAQRELWKRHNFNPLGGCWLMFLQLPIFIGLYRCLSVDIELRQAALIPGLEWCSNLAGPDMAVYWGKALPAFLGSETGWLGPYLNILPIFTIVLFLVQQKMFTPPATDDQTRMQQSMMKYMMIFMGLLFFKVASGLCVYFIASSLWGIGERKLLPKPAPPKNSEPAKPPESPAKPSPSARRTAAPEKKSFLQRLKEKVEQADANQRRASRRKRRD